MSDDTQKDRVYVAFFVIGVVTGFCLGVIFQAFAP